MDSSLISHGVFAVATSIAAYTAWQAPATSGKAEEAVVIAGEPDALDEIRWQDEKHEITVKRTGKEEVAVTIAKRQMPPPDPAPDKPSEAEAGEGASAPEKSEGDGDAANQGAGAEAEGKAAEPPKAAPKKQDVPQTWPGSSQALELFASLMPLRANRLLGESTESETESFGLTDPKHSLTLVVGGNEKKVELGGTTYGTGDRYAKVEEGKAFLLRSSLVSPLRHGASGLCDRRVTRLEKETIERVKLNHGETERELILRNPDEPSKSFYADPGEPDKKLERLSNLIDQALRLRVAKFADDQTPPTDPPALRLEFFAAKGSVGVIEFWEPNDEGTTIKSSFFQDLLHMPKHSAKRLLKDLADVVGEKPNP